MAVTDEAAEDWAAAIGALFPSLYAFWDAYWNKVASCDYGDHSGYTYQEGQLLDDLAGAVEEKLAELGPDAARAYAAGQDGDRDA